MNRKKLLYAAIIAVVAGGCSKKNDNPTAAITNKQVITDFVNTVAQPQYAQLQQTAERLNAAVQTLNGAANAANLEATRTAWRDMRSVWEQCEGFLLGPVSDDNYDPNMDTWPVDYHQLDSFIGNSPSFGVDVVQHLSQGLRGFHPLEFILWGKDGAATADSITARQKQYMVALSADLLNNATQLNNSWLATGGNFRAQVLTAGEGSTRFATRQDALLAIVAGMSDICGEVGDGKIKEPYATTDSTITESPFSHNSMSDFTNNMKGAQNVYLCAYNGSQGASLSALVAARNIALDNKIKTRFAAAIAALNNVSATFEVALHSQRTQLQNAMTAILELQETLNGDLKTYVQTYVKD